MHTIIFEKYSKYFMKKINMFFIKQKIEENTNIRKKDNIYKSEVQVKNIRNIQ